VGQTIGYPYEPATGNLVTAAISGGETPDWTYTGGLNTSDAWSGPVAGTVAPMYDHNFWKTALTVNDGSPLNFAYDHDGLVTTAGALTILRTADGSFTAPPPVTRQVLRRNIVAEVIEKQKGGRSRMYCQGRP
jgi:hypothetical protein